MNAKALRFTILMAVLTALTLAGSIYLLFEIIGLLLEMPNLHMEGAMGYVVGFSLFFAIPLVGGALWGLGIALLMKATWEMLADVKRLAWGGAFTWGVSVLIAGFALYFSQIPIAEVDPKVPLDADGFFIIVFVPPVGIAAALNTRQMAARMGLDSLKNMIARNSGLAAALAFLIVSLALLAVGWEVAGPFAGRKYSMIKIMHVCNFGATLAGGAAMGCTLVRGQEDAKPTNASDEFSTLTSRI